MKKANDKRSVRTKNERSSVRVAVPCARNDSIIAPIGFAVLVFFTLTIATSRLRLHYEYICRMEIRVHT